MMIAVVQHRGRNEEPAWHWGQDMKSFGYCLLGVFTAAMLIVAPASVDLAPMGFDDNAAFARNGGGQGGGNAGGNGNAGGKGGKGGKSSGHATASVGDDDEPHGTGLGHVKGKGLGHTKGHGVSATDDGAPKGKGLTASSLGRLNAAHASDTARAHAAPNSTVGRIAAFGNALEAGDIEAAAEALADAANKSISPDVVSATAGLMGVDVDEATAEAVSDAANAED